ncbi:hypothetical protein ABZ671_23875 [Micromonospora sp. NPDC006766]|uniref:hypothetical protein n=1 Tax=Micromonospora sp. NPDC006766 TaxID=3154778 RepID=UPI003409BBC2
MDITMVAHPAVTLIVDLSEGEGLGYDTQGWHQHDMSSCFCPAIFGQLAQAAVDERRHEAGMSSRPGRQVNCQSASRP